MRSLFVVFLWICSPLVLWGQSEFHLPAGKSKVVIPFQMINNLVFIPITVNGVTLTFLLDTGVEETLLFSLEDQEQIPFYHVEKLKLKGLGSNEAVEGYKTTKNILDAHGYKDMDHDIYVVLDQEFNFSSQVGIPVNGIIGYHFFKNHPIEIDYAHKRVVVYDSGAKVLTKRLKRHYTQEPITILDQKPYYTSLVVQKGREIPSRVLIDTGNSDALWIFKNKTRHLQVPEPNLPDYLGRGFSGAIYGLRGRIDRFQFGGAQLEYPIVTMPDSTAFAGVHFVTERVGSIGGEVLSRFDVVFDYEYGRMYTKPNDKVAEPFRFNMSGIEIEHGGLEWTTPLYESASDGIKIYTQDREETQERNVKIRFELKPVFTIANVRSGSQAEQLGVKQGDRLLRINSRMARDLTIEKINDVLRSEEGRKIELELERQGRSFVVSIVLKSIL
jgi:hypothetical protein